MMRWIAQWLKAGARPYRDERGIALLASLMAMALMTVMVVDFTYSVSSGAQLAANQSNELRADYLARSAVNVGLALLAEDALRKGLGQTHADGLTDLWATPFPPLPVGGGYASVMIIDETRKINVNALVAQNGTVNTTTAATLEALFTNVGVSLDIIPALIDWLDPDSVVTNGGAEAQYYEALTPPYAPRNGPMPTIGDLKMVRGVNELTFLTLNKYLTTAPEQRVNINTAPPEVLLAVDPQLANSPSAVQAILEARQKEPFTDLSSISSMAQMGTEGANLSSLFTIQSDYFTITGIGSYAGTRKFVYATVRRSAQGPFYLASWHED